MRLAVLIAPVVAVAALQASGCSFGGGSEVGGVYRSDSAGAHFDASNTLVGTEDGEPGSIASFPLQRSHRPTHTPDEVYVAAGNRGLVISRDGGSTWEHYRTALANVGDVVALANGVIIISGTDAEGQGFIMRSGDEAESWQVVLTVPRPVETNTGIIGGSNTAAAVVISISPDPFHDDRVWAGTSLGNILLGEQSAKTWRTIYTLSESSVFGGRQNKFAVRELVASPHVEGELLIISQGNKLYRVHDEAQEELVISQFLTSEGPRFGAQQKEILTATYIPTVPQALFIGVNDGAVITQDRGATWQQLPLPIDVVDTFNGVAVASSPTNEARLLVGVNNVIYRSEDGGKNWNTFILNAPQRAIVELLIDPQNAARVLAITTPLDS